MHPVRYDPERDAYAIVGVDPSATREAIDKAYRKAALMWHPDKTPAPDAAQRFGELIEAVSVLRDPDRRREYDRLRTLHLGTAARARRRTTEPPEAHAPMQPPPPWLAERVQVHFDAVLFSLEMPQAGEGVGRIFGALAWLTLGAGLVAAKPLIGALALVLFAIRWMLKSPPHHGMLAWAKIAPGRRQAEYHILDQRIQRYDRYTIPYARLFVAVVPSENAFRVEIRGFPRSATPVLHRTRNLTEARRCAREAGQWLQLPYDQAA